jgi:hypothetical protein
MAANPISRNEAAMNLSTFERIGSTIMGAALVLRALGGPSLGRAVLALGGAAMLHRGITGHCAAYDSLRISTALPVEMPAKALVRKKEAAALGLDPANLSEEALIAAMVKNPIIVERPIVVSGGKAALGRPPEKVLAVI